MKIEYDICIIGAGVIGASIARELSQYNLNVLILEQNPSFALETSQGNSGLIHGGFDPTPGKLNAKLNQLGKERFKNDWFKEMDFMHKNINSLVLAFDKSEEEHLTILLNNGFKNGCKSDEIKIIDQDEILRMEPNLNQEVKKALLCTSSVVVDPVELTGVLLKNAVKNGCTVYFNQKVVSIKKEEKLFNIKTDNNIFFTKKIINCAGHYADIIAKFAGYNDFELSTKRGEYLVLNKNEFNCVNNVLFMVPSIHGKGVIVAPTLTGKILVGPTAEDDVPKEDTRLITKKMEENIIKIGKKIIPNLDETKISLRFSGSRPIHKESDDFYIKFAKMDNDFINVAGMKSPALSAAPAIADYVIALLQEEEKFIKKNDWDPLEKNILYKE